MIVAPSLCLKGGRKQMYRAKPILTAFLFLSSSIASTTSLASDDLTSLAPNAGIASSSDIAQEANLVRQLALALDTGGDTLNRFRGPAIEDEEGKDRFDPPTPGMDCSVDEIANYVSCYGSTIENKEEAGYRFIRLINELQAVLPSDDWRGAETQPRIDAIRSYTFEDRHSDAHIDIHLIAQLVMEGKYSYLMTVFGWGVTGPRL
jgi:hypothetical protein